VTAVKGWMESLGRLDRLVTRIQKVSLKTTR
jgi:hypothetical protein